MLRDSGELLKRRRIGRFNNMPGKDTSKEDEQQHIITIKDDAVYGYVDIIDKLMWRKKPNMHVLLRRKAFDLGTYRIRNGQTKRMTEDEITILDVQQVLWIKLSNEEAQQVLGTDQPPMYGGYLRDLRKYFGKHDMSFMNLPFMNWHTTAPVPRLMQEKLF